MSDGNVYTASGKANIVKDATTSGVFISEKTSYSYSFVDATTGATLGTVTGKAYQDLNGYTDTASGTCFA